MERRAKLRSAGRTIPMATVLLLAVLVAIPTGNRALTQEPKPPADEITPASSTGVVLVNEDRDAA